MQESKYTSTLDYLLDELQIINLYLLKRFEKFGEPTNDEHPLDGLAISNEKISKIFHELITDKKEEKSQIKEKIIELKKQIEKNNPQPEYIPLERLKIVLNLSEFEKETILLCLAPEIDSSYGIVYAFLQDNISKKSVSPNLILDILCNTTEEKIIKKKYLSENSKLFKFGILENHESEITGLTIKLNSKAIEFLLNMPNSENKIKGINLMKSEKNSSIYKNEEDKVVKFFKENKFGTCIIQGVDKIEKKIFVENTVSQYNQLLLYVDMKKLFNETNIDQNAILAIYRNVVFYNPSVCIENISALYEHPLKSEIKEIIKNIEKLMSMVHTQNLDILFLDIDDKLDSEIINMDKSQLINLPKLNSSNREQIWRSYLQDKVDSKIIRELAKKFKFNSNQIKSSYLLAKKSSTGNWMSSENLHDACRQQYTGPISDSVEDASYDYWD